MSCETPFLKSTVANVDPGNYTTLLAWSLVEIVFGVITASLPTLAHILPGGVNSTVNHSGTAVSHTGHTLTQTQSRGGYNDQSVPSKPRLGADEYGIMRQDEIELSSSAASEVDVESGAPSVPYDHKAMSHRLDEKQPPRYGPLDYNAR